MKVYEAWKKSLELMNSEREEAIFWGGYYDKETQNYKKILGEKLFALKGTEAELAEPVQYGARYVCGVYRRSKYQP